MVMNSGKTFGDLGLPNKAGTRQVGQSVLLSSAAVLRQAVEQGVTKADLPMPIGRRKQVIEGLIENLQEEIPTRVAEMKKQRVGSAMLRLLAKDIEKDVIRETDKSIDSASLAAASTIMPRLAKSNHKPPHQILQDWKDFSSSRSNNVPLFTKILPTKTQLPNGVVPDILAGLGEGSGEDILPTTNKLATVGGGGIFAPEKTTLPNAEDFAALMPGRENLPAFDMSPRQKAAFAQQMLEQQLAQPSDEDEAGDNVPSAEPLEAVAGVGATNGAPARPTSGTDQLLQLQQDIADSNKGFAATGKSSLADRAQHTKYSQYRHKKHRYQELLAHDKKYRTAQRQRAGLTGDAQQGLARKAIYFVGLSALEKQADKVGEKLRYNIEHGKFEGFIVALVLALIVDGMAIGAILIDGSTLTAIIMWVVNAILLIILGVIIFGHGHYFRRWVVKHLFGKQIVRALVSFFSAFLEFAPTGNVIPMWTIQILWMKYDVDKAIKTHKEDLRHLNNEIKKELRRAKHGQVNLHKIAKLQAKLDKIQKKAYV